MVSLLLLIILASIMVSAIIGTIYYIENKVNTYVHLFFSYFILIMMALMLIGAIIYLYSPSNLSLGIAVAINMVSMIIILAFFFSVAENLSKQVTTSPKILYSLSSLLVLNEALMGAAFSLAEYGNTYFLSVIEDINVSLNNVWFFYPMMVEMLFTIVIIILNFNQLEDYIYYVIPLIGIAAFPPTILNFNIWIYSALVIDIFFAAYGFLKSNSAWKVIYSILVISMIPIIFNVNLFFGLAISISMVYFYQFLFMKIRMTRKKIV